MYEIILVGESLINLAFLLVYCNLVDIIKLIHWHVLWLFVDEMSNSDLMMQKPCFSNKSPFCCKYQTVIYAVSKSYF